VSEIDKRLRIVVPEQFIVNGEFNLFGFTDYLKADGSSIVFEYTYESEIKKTFADWWKNVVAITKCYFK